MQPDTGYHVSMLARTLICHPSTPDASIRRIAVRVRRLRGGTLVLIYRIEGDLNRVRWPPPRSPQRADELWRHTCCELFLAERGQTGYCEFNFSPSTEWAVYRFAAYRESMAAVENTGRLRIAPRARANRIELVAVVDLDALSPPLAGADLRLAVSAIIQGADGRLSCWALRHPSARPDFHHPDSFALALDRIAPSSGRAKPREQTPITQQDETPCNPY